MEAEHEVKSDRAEHFQMNVVCGFVGKKNPVRILLGLEPQVWWLGNIRIRCQDVLTRQKTILPGSEVDHLCYVKWH